ncbi:MAG: tRNA (adenosine(37)-N6)-threonylcarbamoyltransferase complex dimerization subunit type 1 TsaB [Flavobacteriaceae bacterium]|nr:MAG: tRNA (adenosine(37)-N6)-threonylcarbamoyltransferase complex dimerization subunit type 1 TsaB [Flavobacteriaceae bacterium]
MTTILNIETATKNCSVSIAVNGVVIEVKEVTDVNYSHAEKLHPFILEVVSKGNGTFKDIDAIAISKGPGSYTGLRIGVSAAKGLAFVLGIPLISVDTLTSLALSVSVGKGFIVPMLDARRMEVYATVFDSNVQKIRETKAEIIDNNSFQDYLEKDTVYFLGDGSQKCKEIITHPNAVFIDDKLPSAREMASLSYRKYKENHTENIAYFEPFYLKDFIVTKSKL